VSLVVRNRKYTLEFKTQAVELARALGSATEAAQKLGIPAMNIYVWKRRLGSKHPERLSIETETPDQELKRLRREVSNQKQVIHILKSAAAFFCQDQQKNDLS
jgi:transposase-like protein